MINTNEQVPDMEKLDRHEFNMDIEERNTLLSEREKSLREVLTKWFIEKYPDSEFSITILWTDVTF